MNRRGHRGRVDGNQWQVVADLRKMGCRVLSLAPMGDGCADLLVLHRDRLFLVEVKNPDGGKLTADQEEFCSRWPVIVAESADEAFVEIVKRGMPRRIGWPGQSAP